MGRKALNKDIDPKSQKRAVMAEAAMPYFMSFGIKNFSMDSLAQSLNKSKTTVYKYFLSREDLVEFIIRKKIMKLQNFESILHNSELEYIDRYEQSINYIGSVLKSISNKFLLEVSETYPELWQEVQLFRKKASFLLDEYYQVGIKKGYFKKINPHILILTDQLFFESILSPKFLKRADITIEKALQEYFKLKCHGMLAST